MFSNAVSDRRSATKGPLPSMTSRISRIRAESERRRHDPPTAQAGQAVGLRQAVGRHEHVAQMSPPATASGRIVMLRLGVDLVDQHASADGLGHHADLLEHILGGHRAAWVVRVREDDQFRRRCQCASGRRRDRGTKPFSSCARSARHWRRRRGRRRSADRTPAIRSARRLLARAAPASPESSRRMRLPQWRRTLPSSRSAPRSLRAAERSPRRWP